MALRVFEIMREEREAKKNRGELRSKQVENSIRLELLDKLKEYLKDNDSVEIEVAHDALGEFVNILSDEVLAKYNYVQISDSVFSFSDEVIEF